MSKKYTIESKAGVVHGTYEGASEKEAFMAMLAESGDDGAYGDAHVGTEADWIIKPAGCPRCAELDAGARRSWVSIARGRHPPVSDRKILLVYLLVCYLAASLAVHVGQHARAAHYRGIAHTALVALCEAAPGHELCAPPQGAHGWCAHDWQELAPLYCRGPFGYSSN
jgi:hypothetical protein